MFLSLFVPEPKVSVDATRRDDYRVSPQVLLVQSTLKIR